MNNKILIPDKSFYNTHYLNVQEDCEKGFDPFYST